MATTTSALAPLVLRDGTVVAWAPRVRSLKGVKPQRVPAGGVYIGRALSMGGWRLAASTLANPYGVGDPAAGKYTLADSLQLYADLIGGNSTLRTQAATLVASGVPLYCWCHSLTPRGAVAKSAHLCHGDILVALFGGEGTGAAAGGVLQ